MENSKKESRSKKEQPYGYIYKITNQINGKVYIGKTNDESYGTKDSIKSRFRGHASKANQLQHKRDANPEKKFLGTHLSNSINKYGIENFKTEPIDIAYSLDELNEKERYHVKENDSMNPDKGYNMREGGNGGPLGPDALERLKESITEKWQDEEYREKQIAERRERAQTDQEWLDKMTEINQERGREPTWREKMAEINRERAKNPIWLATMAEVITDKWQDEEYRDKQTKERKERAKDPNWIEKMKKINQERAKDPEWLEKMKEICKLTRKEINLRETLNDIKAGLTKKEILTKQDIGGKTFNKRIKEHFGPERINNFIELRDYLKGKSVDDVVREVEERSKLAEAPPGERGQEQKPSDGPELKEGTPREEKNIEAPEQEKDTLHEEERDSTEGKGKKKSDGSPKEEYLHHDNSQDSRKGSRTSSPDGAPRQGSQGGGASGGGLDKNLMSRLKVIGDNYYAFEGDLSGGGGGDLSGLGSGGGGGGGRSAIDGGSIDDEGDPETGSDLEGLGLAQEDDGTETGREDDHIDGDYGGW